MGVIMLDMTKLCATDGCTSERVTGNKGAESYCRQHKNEIARKTRAAGKGPEVFTQQVCANVSCDTVFDVSSWGPLRRYCSSECMDGAPKAARAVARAERQERRAHELATMTEKFCPGLPATAEGPEDRCGVKPVEEFYSVKGRLDTICREHRKMAGRRYDAAHPETRREGKRQGSMALRLSKMTYKGRPMTVADRDAELASDPLCRACRTRPATDADHDHVTGAFRGMLCRKCNLQLHESATVQWHANIIDYYRRAEGVAAMYPILPLPAPLPEGSSLCVCGQRPPEPGRRLCRECRNTAEAEARVSRKDSLRGRPCAREGCSEPRYETDSQIVSYCAKHWRERSTQNRQP
jgi:hypothetical protein